MRSWNSYFDWLRRKQKFPEDYLDLITKVVKLIGIDPTQAAWYEDRDYIQLVWDIENHHLDIDLLIDGTIDWFYRDRTTGDYDGDECTLNNCNKLNEVVKKLNERNEESNKAR